MKLTYWILIGVVLIVIIFFLVKYFKNKSTQSSNQNNNYQQPIQTLTPGGTSNVSQIINSLFPYFQTGVGAFGGTGSSNGTTRSETGGGSVDAGGHDRP